MSRLGFYIADAARDQEMATPPVAASHHSHQQEALTIQTGSGGTMAARTKKIRHDEETRAKIKAAQIINRLYGHVMGTVELDAAQVSSAKTLLGKVLPDMKPVDGDGNATDKIELHIRIGGE